MLFLAKHKIGDIFMIKEDLMVILDIYNCNYLVYNITDSFEYQLSISGTDILLSEKIWLLLG